MKKTDIAYIAGIIDGEGYIGIKKQKVYKCTKRQTPGYSERIQIRMVDEPAICFISESLGGWYYKEKPSAKNGKPLFCFQASDTSAVRIIKTVLPFLRIKKQSALTLLALRKLKGQSKKFRTKITGYRNFPNFHGVQRMVPNLAYSDEYIAQCETLWLRCKELNRAGV